MRKLILLITIFLLVWFSISFFEKYTPSFSSFLQKPIQSPLEKTKVVTEESVVIDAVKKVGPSVVTVAEESAPRRLLEFTPFFFGFEDEEQEPSGPKNIGSGFIVSKDGLVITNKHVVSDASAKYQIVTSTDKKYDVEKIYRDPLNDVAILKISPSQNPGQEMRIVEMGDSSNLVVGQFVIAIGTALGEFRNTVTTGVISGLGRGITAGSIYQGYVEKIDNVIQTDAAINPGNSGGPLLNSSGQVIGVNTAIAQSGQNIGFAMPINIVKDSLKNFNETGQFERAYLGVSYKMITRDLAIMNNIPSGAYIQKIIASSPAEKAGLKKGDIITKVDDQKLEAGKLELSTVIAKKKSGDTIIVSYWRDGKTAETKAMLTSVSSQ